MPVLVQLWILSPLSGLSVLIVGPLRLTMVYDCSHEGSCDLRIQSQVPFPARTSAEDDEETDPHHPIRETGRRSRPPSPETHSADWIGSMKDSMKIVGDIVSPASDQSDWEALRDCGFSLIRTFGCGACRIQQDWKREFSTNSEIRRTNSGSLRSAPGRR
jgi:hypothetical protein